MSPTLLPPRPLVRRRPLLKAITALAIFLPTAFVQAQTVYQWGLNGAGTWDSTISNNWRIDNTGSLTPWVDGANESVFGGPLTAARAIAIVAGGVTTGEITFDETGAFFYTLGTLGNGITLNNGVSDSLITVERGTQGAATYSGVGGNTISNSILTFNRDLDIVNNGAFGNTALTIASAINRVSSGGRLTIDGQGNTAISGIIGNTVTGGIVKSGTGTLNLSATGATFTGGIAINGGVVTLATGTDSILGNVSNGITLGAGGTFRFGAAVAGGLNAARVITVNGTAPNPSGIDLNTSVTQIIGASQLTGAGAARLSLTGGTTAGILSIEGANSGFTGAFTAGAPGQLIGHVLSSRIFATTNGATLRFQNAGTLANATSFTFSNSSALTITQPVAAVTGRMGTAPITFNSARFLYNPNTNSNVAITENFGTVGLTGQLVISGSSIAGPSAGTRLNFGNLTLNDHATMFFRSPQSGQGAFGGTPAATNVNVFFNNLTPETVSSGTTRSVIPWAGNATSAGSTDPSNFMTYDANGFRALNVTTEIVAPAANGLAAVASGVNVRTNASQTIKTGGQTINSYANTGFSTIVSGNDSASTPGDVLTITSGAIATSQATSFDNTSLNFPSGAYFHLGFPISITNFSRVTGSGGVVASALGISNNYQLKFSNTPDEGNAFTGGLYVNGNATVTFTQNNQLGKSGAFNSGDIVLGGGQLILVGADEALGDSGNNRSIKVNASNGTIGNAIPGGTLYVPGTISGTGQLQFGGGTSSSSTGVVELTNASANTYSGGTVVSTGILRITNPNQLGTGSVLLNGGRLQAGASLNFSSAPVVVATSVIDTQANSITLSAGLNGSGGTAGTTANSMVVTKSGAGTLNITGASTYAGQITMTATTASADGGTLSINGNGQMPELGTVIVNRGDVFNVDDSVVALANRVGGSTNVTLANNNAFAGGGTLNLTTNASGSRMTFGNLTASGGTLAFPNVSAINLIDGGAGNNYVSFQSLADIAANNTLAFNGTTNFGNINTLTGTRVFLNTAPTLSGVGGFIPNANFTGFGGSGQATYDATFGVILYIPTTAANGTVIDNIGAPALVTNTVFTTTGDTTAKTGVRLNSLILDAGNSLNLTNVYAAAPGNGGGVGNGSTPLGTLLLSSGNLSVTATSPKTITAATTGTVAFGVTNAAISLANNLNVASSVTLSGTGGLTKSGAGTLVVNGPNNISGDYSLSAGAMTLNSSVTGVGNFTTAGGTTLTLGPGVTVNSDNASNTSFAGTLAGSGNLIKTGVGMLTLAGTNSAYTGTITVNGGAVIATADANLGATTSALVLNGGRLRFGGVFAIDPTRSITVGAGGGTLDTQSNNIALSGSLSGTGTLTKIGTGKLTASGNLPSISGLTVTTGTFELGASNLLNNAATLTLSGGTFGTGGFNETVGALNVSATSTIDLGSGASIFHLADSHLLTWGGGLNILNWNGLLLGGGTDQIFFGTSNSSLTPAQLALITFINPVGYPAGNYVADGLLANGELVVPEPSVGISLFGGLGALLGLRRRRAISNLKFQI